MANSYITFLIVTKNSLLNLRGCLESIFIQTEKNYKVLVIDANSNDGTKDYLRSISSKHLIYLSEVDDGIYDAMNKGLQLIDSNWVLHLGSDDRLYSNTVLEDLYRHKSFSSQHGIIYTSGLIGNRRLLNNFNWRLYFGNCLNHQCAIYNVNILRKFFYDKSYKIGADYKLNLQLLKLGVSAHYIPMLLITYGTEGISSLNISNARKEELRVRNELLGSVSSTPINLYKIFKWAIIDSLNKIRLFFTK